MLSESLRIRGLVRKDTTSNTVDPAALVRPSSGEASASRSRRGRNGGRHGRRDGTSASSGRSRLGGAATTLRNAAQRVNRQTIARTAVLPLVAHASHAALTCRSSDGSGVEGTAAITFARVFHTEVCVTCAERGACFEGHGIGSECRLIQSSLASSLCLTTIPDVGTDLCRLRRRGGCRGGTAGRGN